MYEDKPFPEYQRLLERFERFNDPLVLPESHLIIRLDASRFGSAWEKLPGIKNYPYTPEVSDWLLATARGLMCIGMKVRYAFIHGDEISLWFDICETINPRKVSRLVAQLSSAAAAMFTNQSTLTTFFDARVLEIPREEWVYDYFFWQRKTGWRNFYSKQLERRGLSPHEANQAVGANFGDMPRNVLPTFRMTEDDAPAGHLFGHGLWWEQDLEEFVIVQSSELPEDNQDYYDFLQSRMRAPAGVAKKDFAQIRWYDYKNVVDSEDNVVAEPVIPDQLPHEETENAKPRRAPRKRKRNRGPKPPLFKVA